METDPSLWYSSTCKCICTHKEKREAPALHDATSYWLHENSIPKFGYQYFWPGLIALPKNTLPIYIQPE